MAKQNVTRILISRLLWAASLFALAGCQIHFLIGHNLQALQAPKYTGPAGSQLVRRKGIGWTVAVGAGVGSSLQAASGYAAMMLLTLLMDIFEQAQLPVQKVIGLRSQSLSVLARAKDGLWRVVKLTTFWFTR